jgi:hypothetical protein
MLRDTGRASTQQENREQVRFEPCSLAGNVKRRQPRANPLLAKRAHGLAEATNPRRGWGSAGHQIIYHAPL